MDSEKAFSPLLHYCTNRYFLLKLFFTNVSSHQITYTLSSMFHFALSTISYLVLLSTLTILALFQYPTSTHPIRPHPPSAPHPLFLFSIRNNEVKGCQRVSALSAPSVSLHFLKSYNFHYKIKLIAWII